MIRAFRVASRELLWRTQTGRGPVQDLDFRVDGARLLAAAGVGGALLLDPDTGATLHTFDAADEAPVVSGRFLAYGRRLVTSDLAGAVEVREADSRSLIWRLEGDGKSCHVAANPAGTIIACSHFDGRVVLRDAATGKTLRTLRGHSRAAYWPGFSPDGRRVATASRDYSLRIWDVETGHELLNFVGTPAWNFRAVFAPDGNWIAVTNSLGEVRIYRR